MEYRIIISTLAKRHIQDSYDWYESQQFSLGRQFRDEIRDQIDKLYDDIVDYQVYLNNIRRVRLKRFPYHVYYERHQTVNTIVVLAVLHSRRRPYEIAGLFK